MLVSIINGNNSGFGESWIINYLFFVLIWQCILKYPRLLITMALGSRRLSLFYFKFKGGCSLSVGYIFGHLRYTLQNV